jgi:transcriptional regulator with XRE-family HTH domain
MGGRQRRSRAEGRLVGRRLARECAARFGSRISEARRRRGWTQAALGGKVGLSNSRISQIEAGNSAGVSLETLFALGHVLDLPLRVEFGRDAAGEPADAGHLKVQELMLRLAHRTGRARTFELPTRPLDTGHSIDVCLRDDAQRVLFIEECWNTFGNINAAVRSTRRKVAEAEQFAVAIGGEGEPYRVAAVWIVRDTRANRQLLARYPEVFATTFSGSSAQWVRALTEATARPPAALGLVWCDVHATRLAAWRRRSA